MYIKTKEFNLTEKQFRQVIALQYFKRMKNLFIIWSILAIIGLVISIISNDYFMLIVSLIVIAYYLSLPYWLNLKKTQPPINFKKRFCEIDENFITFIYEDGSLVKLRFDNFIQVTKESNYYFLYTVKTQFHYLPVAVFNSEQEICRFDLLMEGKQLLKLW